MPTELPKTYEPKDAQQKWLKFWNEKGYFRADPAAPGEPYCIVIPPPNVTGALHMGHALNNTMQDILIRWRRMQGRNTLWMPGTDHAGIATQAVVERLLQAEDKTFKRREYGREKLVAKIWEWKDKYEARILGQLREMGASCDFSRTRFTLDATCAKAVRETFFRMFKDGYIYRGKRLVNWDTQLQTSVSDDETYTETTKGGFWTFQYEVVDAPGTFIRFSTTRPETMLGDTALCVHPSDERYRHLIGKSVTQPHTGRIIPIIADGLLADPELGTGCVKVTPAHDPNDYACWTRHPEIGIINILIPDGTIAAGFGEYSGLDRTKARAAVVAKMEELGLYVDKQDRDIPLPYSDRSKTPIEPFLSDQWFVKMSDRDDGKPGLAQLAIDAVTSEKVKFFPERYAKTYLDWLGEKRDWCVSRQLWWGHRIPVWKITVNCGFESNPESLGTNALQAQNDKLVLNAIRSITEFLKHLGLKETELHIIRDTADEGFLWCCIFNDSIQPQLNELSNYIKQKLTLEYVIDDNHPVEDVVTYLAKFPSLKGFSSSFTSVIGFEQEADVLDTWFSSALWPHSTLGWPEQTPELAKYYPTSTLCTSRDIISLWVARMVLTGLYNVGEVPFRQVYIHPALQDGFGERMSKTKGNGLDPLDIIDLYGTDAMRYGMAAIATETQDSRLPVVNVCPHCGTQIPVKQEHMYMRTKKLACPQCKQPFRPGGPWTTEDPELKTAKQASDRFEVGRNFANKMWNATRFILMNLEGYTPAPLVIAELPTEDRWIVSRLATTAQAMTAALEAFRFAEAARLIYEFTWTEFCDWYIEMSKARRSDPTCQRVLVGVLDGILRLVHPIMPFLAESLWEYLREAAPVRGFPTPSVAEESVCIAKWPEFDGLIDDSTEASIARMQELVRGVREIRNRYQVEDKSMLDLSVKCSAEVAAELTALQPFIVQLGRISTATFGPSVVKPKQSGSVVAESFEASVNLAGLIDLAVETKRTEKQIADLRKQVSGMQGKLNNASYVKNAPPEIVQETQAKVIELEKQIGMLEANLQSLASGAA
jgi:valyl-tRNA synthetase